MSVAGSRSWQGDEFQLCVALHYVIRLLAGELVGLQVESTGLPGQAGAIPVDDVVALLADGRREYVQAKKNQPDHESWKLTDRVLREELKKARDQLESDLSGTVRFFSRSPFGEFRKLQEEARLSPDEPAFKRNSGQAVQASLIELAELLERTKPDTLALLQRVEFGPTREFRDWDAENAKDLERVLPSSSTARSVLERFLASHQSRLRDSKFVIRRDDVLRELAVHNLVPAPLYGERETLGMFRVASRIGRSWPRDIAGTKFQRPELELVLAHIRARRKTVLVAAGPGSGKTCLLLDLADQLEADGVSVVLFIKGDRFAGVDDEERLQINGLPADIVGRCARLASSRHVVVLLDSLDVLSLSRNHGSLRVFLGLLERLEQLDGVTVVAACREFDLKYDPQLRAREWQARVPLALLGYTDIVAPLLRSWDVDPAALGDDMRNLLSVPQHLRLFHRLTKGATTPNLVSSFQLYQRFIDETVTQDARLGDPALRALEDLAAGGIHQRRQTFPRATLNLTADAVQGLVSSAILVEDDTGWLAFSHQTIAESLAVQKALREGQTLTDFILSQPPLPFVRPTVRTFFFCLRDHDRRSFRRQVSGVLGHPDIAYHLKRLVAESLAETLPDDSDWSLFRRLCTDAPSLFQRTIAQARNSSWFELLRKHWLPLLKQPGASAEWRYQYLATLRRWLKSHSRQVVELWTDSLDAGWAPEGATWSIALALLDLPDWTTGGLDKLFSLLVSNGTSRDMLSKPLSLWISATGTGDRMLWDFMTRDASDDSAKDSDELKIRCSPHGFYDGGFLLQRMRDSEDLMTLAANYVDRASMDPEMRTRFSLNVLHETSWQQRHSRHDALPADGATVLVGALEQALKMRAAENDDWWRAHEPQFRRSTNLGIRYMLIEAYRENQAANIAGIEVQLSDPELFRSSQLEYELGTLMGRAYGYISEGAQDRNQEMLLQLYDEYRSEDGHMPNWAAASIHQYALWIPRPFRSPPMAAFMDLWKDEFSAVRASPRIHSWGGAVGAPISRRDLADLDDRSFLRVLEHYCGGRPHETELLDHGGFVGGLDQVRSTVRECAAHEPSRFLKRQQDFDDELALIFGPPIYEGVAEHLRYITGSLSAPNDWSRHHEILAPEDLASTLLRFAEEALRTTRRLSRDAEYSVSRALQAVADTTESEETGERLTLALWRMVNSDDPEPKLDQERFDLGMVSLNSTRGVTAGAAMALYCRWLQLEKPTPRLLPGLLRRLAADPAMGVRFSILNRLPFPVHHDPELGWALVNIAFREPQSHLWIEAERIFYYQYRQSFARVRPLLIRMGDEAAEVAGESYGRIACLAYLAGHAVWDGQPFLAIATTDPIRQGIAAVLCSNLDSRSTAEKCRTTLVEMLRSPESSLAAVAALGREMANEKNDGAIDLELVNECVRALRSGKAQDTWGLCKWLERNCGRHPLVALAACERLVALGEAQEGLRFSTEMVPVLLEILREADETDDPALIRRAVKLQDDLLRLGVHGVDELLDKSALS